MAASLYLKGFERLLQDGRVIRDRVLAVLRIWRVWSLAAGVDVTWGLLGEFTRALGVNPVELEGREAVRWGLCAERRCVGDWIDLDYGHPLEGLLRSSFPSPPP